MFAASCVCLCGVRVVVCGECHRSLWPEDNQPQGEEGTVQEDNLRTPRGTDTEVP